jgi:hypothetical protein
MLAQSAVNGLGSQYGSCDGKAALARETSVGCWQVKVHDPRNPKAGHDGWVLLGTGWSTLHDATVATGLLARN